MKPLLAATAKTLKDIQFPCYCTPKIDGIRCLIYNGQAVSRSLKPIRNRHVQDTLKDLSDGFDGELILRKPSTFNEISSAIMSEKGKPDFVYCVFDNWEWGRLTYLERIAEIAGPEPHWGIKISDVRPEFLPVVPTTINNEQEFLEYEEKCLSQGFEGVMIRNDSHYKFGRSTVREGILLKWKRFVDGEAEILEFIEELENQNVKTKDNLGHSQRSSHQENMVPKGTLGALRVRDLDTGVEFKIGTGFDAALRLKIWRKHNEYADKIVKYKAQPHGAKDKPRFPVFLAFRDPDDMS